MFSSNTSQVSSDAVYVEDVFSNFLYTGNGSTQTITNGIDLAGKGGLVWIKRRVDTPNASNVLTDTARGVQKELYSNSTSAQATNIYGLNSFNADGFGIGNASSYDYAYNEPNKTYVSWTFRKQPKFFDVVTYTGNGSNYRAISHSLGSTPGMVIVKSTSASGAWAVWHRSTDPNNLILNSTSAAISGQYSIQDVGSTSFAVANSSFYGFPQSIPVNDNGATYDAYLFAHNAGGFGLTGTDNVISCGSYTTDAGGNGNPVTLGYEPQWLLVKNTTSAGAWILVDTMRGMSYATDGLLYPNLSNAETSVTGTSYFVPNATGFTTGTGWSANQTYIYIAIRRGPMKTPTSGTSVFAPAIGNTTSSSNPIAFTANFPVDLMFMGAKLGGSDNGSDYDRLRGNENLLLTTSTAAEGGAGSGFALFDNNVGIGYGGSFSFSNYVGWLMRRAPGFFDEVCYTGTGSAGATISHNLGTTPELIITKSRNTAGTDWFIYSAALGPNAFARLNTTAAFTTGNAYAWNNVNPTSSVFTLGSGAGTNGSGYTFAAYLFASCPGVSKVGSYTGNGSTQTINCGFTGGARFVLIKRTDSTGDWYVYDTARGMTTLTDPYLLMNSTAAESATLGSVTTVSTGFAVNASILAAINANGGSYIFLAIA